MELKISEFKQMALEEKMIENDKTQAIQQEIQEKESNYRADLEKYKKELDDATKIKIDIKDFEQKNADLNAELERMKRDYVPRGSGGGGGDCSIQ